MQIGEVYQSNGDGPVKVVSYVNAFKVEIEFLETGNRRFSQATDIRHGQCKDRMRPSVWGVGFVGYGLHRTRSEAGKKWTAMLRRCYDEKWKRNKPSYDGVTVCGEWHNLQNFAEWYYKNKASDMPCDLDKDGVVKGSKVYSPKTCQLIPHSQNVGYCAMKDFCMRSPDGVVVRVDNAAQFCRENGLDRSNLTKVVNGKSKHVKGWTYEGIQG